MISPRVIQAYLQTQGLYSGKLDGLLGHGSKTAMRQLLIAHNISPVSWDDERLLIGVQQQMFIEGGVDRSMVGPVDGFAGPMFRAAFERWQDFQRIAPVWSPPMQTRSVWPKQANVEQVFGKPGANLVSLKLPYPLKIEWSPGQVLKSLQVNKVCATSLEEVLLDVRSAYTEQERSTLGLDVYSGGFTIRPMKSSSRLSMHAYGIAFDFFSQQNQYRWTQAQAAFARPEYEPWWKCWEDRGWVSLGRERDFDWMHVQAAEF